MLKIRKLTLNGFKDENRKVMLDFPEGNTVILYGDNGCGKTSLLRVINAILAHDEEILLEENINHIEIVVQQDEKNELYRIERKIDNIEQVTYDWGNFPNDVTSLIFGVERGGSNLNKVSVPQIISFFDSPYGRKYQDIRFRYGMRFVEDLTNYIQRNERNPRLFGSSRRFQQLMQKNATAEKLDMTTIDEILTRSIRTAYEERNERVRNAIFNTLSDIVETNPKTSNDIEPEIFKKKMQLNRGTLLNILTQMSDNALQKKLVTVLEKEDIEDIYRECQENQTLKNLFVRMLEELSNESGTLKAIHALIQIFNEHITSEKYLAYEEGQFLIIFNNAQKTYHSLNQLSSGEKHLLSLLTGCMIAGQKKDIIMIDEPEISLNVSWKKEILSLLSQLLPNTQIIVATHSSSVVNDNFDAMVRLD